MHDGKEQTYLLLYLLLLLLRLCLLSSLERIRKIRSARTETKLTVTDSPHSGGLLLSMRFPQELVDTIIDEIAGLVTYPQNARSGPVP
jgi:hypothetical protein